MTVCGGGKGNVKNLFYHFDKEHICTDLDPKQVKAPIILWVFNTCLLVSRILLWGSQALSFLLDALVVVNYEWGDIDSKDRIDNEDSTDMGLTKEAVVKRFGSWYG